MTEAVKKEAEELMKDFEQYGHDVLMRQIEERIKELTDDLPLTKKNVQYEFIESRITRLEQVKAYLEEKIK